LLPSQIANHRKLLPSKTKAIDAKPIGIEHRIKIQPITTQLSIYILVTEAQQLDIINLLFHIMLTS